MKSMLCSVSFFFILKVGLKLYTALNGPWATSCLLVASDYPCYVIEK